VVLGHTGLTTILDGYNVIHALPPLQRQMDRSLEAGRDALVRLCQEQAARRGQPGEVYIVFDGREGAGEEWGRREQRHGRVTVMFTRKPEDADQRILRLIETRKRGECLVVSNDNEVANNARAFGARIVSAQEFFAPVPPGGRAAGKPAGPGKPGLPVGEAERITEEYRRHLERRRAS
jgi:predicted RNA-binding protein with PIN domain